MITQKLPKLILLIDDDESINYINKRLLEIHGLGNTILTFVSGKDALNYLQECYQNKSQLPELLFLDIRMPLLNGFEFLDEFEKIEENIKQQCKIVILSSSGLDEDINRVKNNKYIVGFFSKPLAKANIDYLKSLWAD